MSRFLLRRGLSIKVDPFPSWTPSGPFVSPERSMNWYPGHMVKALASIRSILPRVDLVIEARDARLPLSSINPAFEQLAAGRPRLVVYNKADLAQDTGRRALATALDTPTLWTDSRKEVTVRGIIRHAVTLAKTDPQRYPVLTALVVGMPNVGKSSLINAMRRLGTNQGKAVSTGDQPGVTRKVAGTVRIHNDPHVYVIDSPGVMMPYIGDPLSAIKIGLTGGIPDKVTEPEVLIEYLLYVLNGRRDFSYVEEFRLDGPTENVNDFLHAVARRTGALIRGQGPDLHKSALYVIRKFREGKFGIVTLDEAMADEHRIAEWVEYLRRPTDDPTDPSNTVSPEGLPLNLQSRRSIKKAQREAKRKRKE